MNKDPTLSDINPQATRPADHSKRLSTIKDTSTNTPNQPKKPEPKPQ